MHLLRGDNAAVLGHRFIRLLLPSLLVSTRCHLRPLLFRCLRRLLPPPPVHNCGERQAEEQQDHQNNNEHCCACTEATVARVRATTRVRRSVAHAARRWRWRRVRGRCRCARGHRWRRRRRSTRATTAAGRSAGPRCRWRRVRIRRRRCDPTWAALVYVGAHPRDGTYTIGHGRQGIVREVMWGADESRIKVVTHPTANG